METKLDPEIKKAIWKVVLYAVTIFASLFAGNTMAKNGVHFITPKTDTICFQENPRI